MDDEGDLILFYRTTLDSFSCISRYSYSFHKKPTSFSYSSIVQKKKAVKPSLVLFFYFIFCKLTIVEVGIETTLSHELLMIALLDNVSFFHDQD